MIDADTPDSVTADVVSASRSNNNTPRRADDTYYDTRDSDEGRPKDPDQPPTSHPIANENPSWTQDLHHDDGLFCSSIIQFDRVTVKIATAHWSPVIDKKLLLPCLNSSIEATTVNRQFQQRRTLP
jgi:hypothetical protein